MMLHYLIQGDGHVTLKPAAGSRKRWIYTGMISETCSAAED